MSCKCAGDVAEWKGTEPTSAFSSKLVFVVFKIGKAKQNSLQHYGVGLHSCTTWALLRLMRCQDGEPNWELEIVMWGCPAFKTRTSSWWDSPQGLGGLEQAMKSTCLEHEEVRQEKPGRGCPPLASKNPASWWNVHSASLSNLQFMARPTPGGWGWRGSGAF